MPRTQIYSANLTASAKTANIFSGDVNEFIPYDAHITFYAVSSATGVRITLMADSDVFIDDKEIPNIGTTLSTSDHIIDEVDVAAGTRLTCFLRETAAAGTTDVYVAFDVTPL